jgi:hypothetical protein
MTPGGLASLQARGRGPQGATGRKISKINSENPEPAAQMARGQLSRGRQISEAMHIDGRGQYDNLCRPLNSIGSASILPKRSAAPLRLCGPAHFRTCERSAHSAMGRAIVTGASCRGWGV